MIGRNELILNEATMVEVLQHYLTNILYRDMQVPHVKEVTFKDGDFKIILEGPTTDVL